MPPSASISASITAPSAANNVVVARQQAQDMKYPLLMMVNLLRGHPPHRQMQILDWVWRGRLEEIAVAMAMILLMLTQRTWTTDQWQLWDSSIYGSSFYPYFVFSIGIPTYSISDLVSTIYVIHFDFDYIRWLNENTTVYCSKHLVLFYDMHNLNILVSCLFDLDYSLMLHV